MLGSRVDSSERGYRAQPSFEGALTGNNAVNTGMIPSGYLLPEPTFGGRFLWLCDVVLGALDDLVLERAGDVAEIVRVAGDADDEIAVVGGVALGLAQGLG